MYHSENLCDALKDSSRPSFLFGSTPPREGTTTEKAREACKKFAARSAVLATDGFIVYDIQDEAGRTTMERPFPFRKTMDAAEYASFFPAVSGKQCVVYKCVVEDSIENYDKWLDTACNTYGHNAFNLVGAPTSSREYKGPSLIEAGLRTVERNNCDFGCVCIAERHTKKGNEDENMMRKVRAGAQWFITQGIFDAAPLVKLLHDYGAACRREGVVPRKIILTFAPCGRPKTMTFIKWLGMQVPADVEKRIMEAENPVDESCVLLNELLLQILEQSAGSGVPLGLNVESLSIFKEEINAAHSVFQTLQATMLNSRGSPWAVRWFCVNKFLSGSMASQESLLRMEAHAKELEIENRIDKVIRRRAGSFDSVVSRSTRGGGGGGAGNDSVSGRAADQARADQTHAITIAGIAISAVVGGFFLGQSVRGK
jgi:hypothetical protein